jgi:hypothetical protein
MLIPALSAAFDMAVDYCVSRLYILPPEKLFFLNGYRIFLGIQTITMLIHCLIVKHAFG